jgi:hypothetical protein
MRLMILATALAIADVIALALGVGLWWDGPVPILLHVAVYVGCVAMAMVGSRRLHGPKIATRAVRGAVSLVLIPIGVLFVETSSVVPVGSEAHLAALQAPDDASEEEIRRLAGEPHMVWHEVRENCAARGGVRSIAYTESLRAWWGYGYDYPSGSVVFCVNRDGKVVERKWFQY